MSWTPDRDALRGRVAVVAGATRGAGRGIAAALGEPGAPPDFALSESPRSVGRAVVALAADPDRARWNQQSVTSGALAVEYGFTDVEGSRPEVWRYIRDVEASAAAGLDTYR